MDLFKKKEKKEIKEETIPRLPDLPKLPELSEFNYKEDFNSSKLSPLPSLPNEAFTEKYSQYSIKNAVTGKKEGEEEANDFAIESEIQTMQKPLTTKEKNSYSKEEKSKTNSSEPLFIRIDKFEDGSRAFEEVKKQISEVEKFFNDLKKVKEREEDEIVSFENEIKQIKEKLENIDKNIFSKIE